jgi:hypothetical protein
MLMNIWMEQSNNNTPIPIPAKENQREIFPVPVCNNGFMIVKDALMVL